MPARPRQCAARHRPRSGEAPPTFRRPRPAISFASATNVGPQPSGSSSPCARRPARAIPRGPAVPTRIVGGTAGGLSRATERRLHERARGVDRLAGEQPPDRGHHLAERGQPLRGPGVDLGHPRLDPVTEGHRESAGEHPAEGANLHRDDRRVAHGGREQPDAHMDALRGRERGRSERQPARQETVLDHPELVVPERLGASCERRQVLGRCVRRKDEADRRSRG